MALMKNLKLNYYGFFGFLGFYGFAEPAFFLFFLFFLFFIVDTKGKPAFGPKGYPRSGVVRQTEVKQENLQKILEALEAQSFGTAQDEVSPQVTNDDVQRLLGVSDATAERYLNELEKQGILKQSGNTGKHVFYTKI